MQDAKKNITGANKEADCRIARKSIELTTGLLFREARI